MTISAGCGPLLQECFGSRFSRLDPLAVQAVVTARMEGSVTNARMQEIAGEHLADITAALQQLVRDGLLAQRRQGRWASYSVTGDSPQTLFSSPQSAPGSPQSAGDSPQSAPDSPQSVCPTSPIKGAGLENDPHLLALAAPARGRARMPKKELQALIETLCTGRWLNSRELGVLLGRDPENLQERFLTGMVRAGKLQLKSPDVPNRPDQAYRTR